MTTAPNSPQSAGAATDVAARLDQSERQLREITKSTRRGNVITIVVAVILFAILGGYFSYGYRAIASILEPDTLLDAAENWVEQQLPEVRKSLETEVNKSAPVWAESLSKQAQSSLPSIREKMEEYVLQQVDQAVEQSVSISEDSFRKFLREKRDVLEAGFKDLASSPKLAEESLARLENEMNSSLGADMHQGARDLYQTLNQMSDKLARLKSGVQLSPQEQLERNILMQFRRLQLQNIAEKPPEQAQAVTPESVN